MNETPPAFTFRPEIWAHIRAHIRATQLDCAGWTDDVLDEIGAAVLKGLMGMPLPERSA